MPAWLPLLVVNQKFRNHGNQREKNSSCDGMSGMSRFRRGALQESGKESIQRMSEIEIKEES